MTDFDLEYIGLGILAAFFGIYDEKVMEEMKLLIGKFVIEKGGAEKVFEQNYKNAQKDIPKRKIIEALNECVELAKSKRVIDEK